MLKLVKGATEQWDMYAARLRTRIEDLERELAEAKLLLSQATTSRWIPVSERLPKDDQEIVFYNTSRMRYLGIYGHGAFWAYGKGYTANILGWMPLPKPPKEGT